MAGDWLKIEKATARKPEVLRISVALGIHPDEAFGICFRFWSWCDDQLAEGNAPGVTETLVDSIVGRSGFASALLSVGWLQVRSGSLVIPHFDRHLSESAKKRALTAKRVSSHKSKKGNAENVTSALPEKRREEINTVTPSRTHGGTWLEGLSEDFKRWWECLPAGMRSGQKACWNIWPEILIDIQGKLFCDEPTAIAHLIDRTRLFANSPKGQESRYRWKPETFLKDGHYDDSLESWEIQKYGSDKRTDQKSKFDRQIDVLERFAAEDG